MFNRNASVDDDDDLPTYINRLYPLPPLFPELNTLLTPTEKVIFSLDNDVPLKKVQSSAAIAAATLTKATSVPVAANKSPALPVVPQAIALPTMLTGNNTTTAMSVTSSTSAMVMSSAPPAQENKNLKIKIPYSMFSAATQEDHSNEDNSPEIEYKPKRRYMLANDGPVYDTVTGVRKDRLPPTVRRPVVSQGAIFRREYRFNDTGELLTATHKKELQLNANDQVVCMGREVTWWKQNKTTRAMRVRQTFFNNSGHAVSTTSDPAALGASTTSDPVPVLMRVVPEKPTI